MSLRPALFAAMVALTAPAAEAASVTLDSLTTPIATNARVTHVPAEVSEGRGNMVASGQLWSGGTALGGGIADAFLAWCFDIVHPVSLGRSYSYRRTDEPFENSWLKAGAESRIAALVNAVYDQLDPTDKVQAAGFQIAVWDVANDDDFDLSSGAFRARGRGSDADDISAAGQAFLDAGAAFDGPSGWTVHFLQTQERAATQNLVTATRNVSAVPDVAPVPLPAAGLLLMAGLGGLVAARRRARA